MRLHGLGEDRDLGVAVVLGLFAGRSGEVNGTSANQGTKQETGKRAESKTSFHRVTPGGQAFDTIAHSEIFGNAQSVG